MLKVRLYFEPNDDVKKPRLEQMFGTVVFNRYIANILKVYRYKSIKNCVSMYLHITFHTLYGLVCCKHFIRDEACSSIKRLETTGLEARFFHLCYLRNHSTFDLSQSLNNVKREHFMFKQTRLNVACRTYVFFQVKYKYKV